MGLLVGLGTTTTGGLGQGQSCRVGCVWAGTAGGWGLEAEGSAVRKAPRGEVGAQAAEPRTGTW